MIAVCYGGYTINFKDRELLEDRIVNVILLRRTQGTPLDELPLWETNDSEKESICSDLNEILRKLNSCGVFLPQIQADQMIVDRTSRRVYVTNLLYWSEGGNFLEGKLLQQAEGVKLFLYNLGYCKSV